MLDLYESLPSVTPVIPDAASFQLGWMELQAARYRNSITNEFGAPPISQHALILVTRPPEKMNLRYGGEPGQTAGCELGCGDASRERLTLALAGKQGLAAHLPGTELARAGGDHVVRTQFRSNGGPAARRPDCP